MARLSLLALLATATCAPDTATVLTVSVTSKPGVHDVANLDISFSQGSDVERTLLGKAGQTIAMPTSFVIRADGRTGPASVKIQAKDQNDRLRGEGQASVTLLADEEVPLSVVLFPSDFPVNDLYQTSQLFSTTATARQVSSDGKGNFVGVWEDTCPLSRCDIYYRLFDAKGLPKLNGMTNKTTENVANESNGYYDMPAVAMQQDGHFVTAWYRSDTQLGTDDIRSRAFLPNGRPDDQSDGGKEMLLSSSDATAFSTPDVAALLDHTYVVVWQQEKDSQQHVMGRYLGPHGRPTKPSGGNNEPFVVASFPTATSQPDPNPAVAPGKNNGFMVVWRQQGKLWGRTYGPAAAPNAPAVGISGTDKVGGFDVGTMLAGYGVVWDDAASCGADATPPCIRFRRYNLVGAAQEEAWTLNTTTAGKQTDPAVAARGDSSLLVVWGSEDDGTADPESGIRGRALLSVGLPVGDDFAINTTTVKDQESPSVSVHNTDSFVVLFRDLSQLGPDTDGGAIRGRLFYPTYEPKDGKIGAACDSSNTCQSGLKCVNAGVGNRCVTSCTGPGSACPAGGKCTVLSGNLGNVCLYQ